MYLASVSVTGFQSFDQSGEVRFEPGINLIVGQNNSGKSSLLRAIAPPLPDDRHRNAERFEQHLMPPPRVEFCLGITGEEFVDVIKRQQGNYTIPIPFSDERRHEYIINIFTSKKILVEYYDVPGSPGQAIRYPSYRIPGNNATFPQQDRRGAVITSQSGNINATGVSAGGTDQVPSLARAIWEGGVFMFTAQRYNISSSQHQYTERLASDASNLPSVLDTIFGARGDVFNLLVEHMREIFPTVGNISVMPDPSRSNQNEIRVWSTKHMRRREHSFSLDMSGTGVSQILAILTAIMTLRSAVILIDEVSSFLHPSATKTLLRLIQTKYSQHQYIITTHSPEVISFANPSTLHLVRRDGYSSSVTNLDLSNIESFRQIAEHLGISMSDVFAAERIVWVEGQTEEMCFPYIHRETVGPLPRGLVFLSVCATGDFNSRRTREIVFGIYDRLSSAAASLPVSVTFSFDSERLSENERADMIRRSSGALHFLPRRHFGCYLIDADAIFNFITEIDESPASDLTPIAVTERISVVAQRAQFSMEVPWSGDVNDRLWASQVDAANLIKVVIGELTEERIAFSKKEHSFRLLRYLLLNKPNQIVELQDYVAGLASA